MTMAAATTCERQSTTLVAVSVSAVTDGRNETRVRTTVVAMTDVLRERAHDFPSILAALAGATGPCGR